MNSLDDAIEPDPPSSHDAKRAENLLCAVLVHHSPDCYITVDHPSGERGLVCEHGRSFTIKAERVLSYRSTETTPKPEEAQQ